MTASFFVNSMQVDFESVLAMEHTGMAKMFKSLEEIGLKGFLEASGSVYEAAVVEFFAAKVIAVTIVSFVNNRKLALTKDVFAETFGLPTEGLIGFLDIPSNTMAEMRMKVSGIDAPFRAPNKKKEMKMEYRRLHEIVSKALCAKAGSCDVVTSEKFDLMVAISVGLKVNWAQILFQTLVVMVNTPTKQSQGFTMQVSVLLHNLVKSDLGELVNLHSQKVLNNKSVHTYIKKNLNVIPASDSSKKTEDTATGTEGRQSQMTNTVDKEVETMVGKKKNKTEKVVPAVKKRKVVVSKPVEAKSQADPVSSTSETSSDVDSRPLVRLNKGGAKRKLVVESSDSESTMYVPPC
ncbi:hypothetical protein F511_34000 [Dorcoceras hygrometricum]|uniref:Dystroglycan-like n=1 Tax=Dorcoceras hygrometricum TaxID=472368 RepID=A0A2Z7A9J1_9LAMI|nr:hypothetical protein F511_34000 [Dorcoceras hygrometricum]